MEEEERKESKSGKTKNFNNFTIVMTTQHLDAHVASLDGEARAALTAALNSLPLSQLQKDFESALEHERKAKDPADKTYTAVPGVVPLATATAQQVSAWRAAGLDLVRQGKVCSVLLAGGQGTRLGSARPKGEYNVGLPSGSSLFRVQAERIKRVSALAGEGTKVSPWYIMTSPQTDADTRAHFKEHDYFGLGRDNVFFFVQGTLPAFDNQGGLLLETQSSLCTAPNGNGGIYEALHGSGALRDMRERGVEHVMVYSVDNILSRVCDPVFFGFMASRGADCGAKVVAKKHEDEKVGVVCLDEGRVAVVEYSEIGPERSKSRNPDGSLTFNAGNICYHYYTVGFLESIPRADLFHIARKKIPFFDPATKAVVHPDKPNGIKLETFIFDKFGEAKNFQVLEVPREDEFSPVKNAEGSNDDSPDTARSQYAAQSARFLQAAGAVIPEAILNEGIKTGQIEVLPSTSYAGEGLEAFKGKTLDTLPIKL